MGFIKNLFFLEPIPNAPEMPNVQTVMTTGNINSILSGRIQTIPVKKLVLKRGENCLFCDYGVQINEKLCTVSRHGGGYGASIRIFKGLTWHTINHDTQHVRDKVPEYTKGKFYITDKRIIFSADSKAFQKNIDSIISYRVEEGCLIIQFTNSAYRIFLPVPECAEKVIEYVL